MQTIDDSPSSPPNTPLEKSSEQKNTAAQASAPQVQVVVVPVVVPVPLPIPPLNPAKSLPREDGFSEKIALPCEENFEPQSEKKSVAHEISTPPSAFALFWRKFGGAGFVASSIFHFALIIFALFFVFAEYAVPVEAEAMFISGAGGGNDSSFGKKSRDASERAFRRQPSPESFSQKIVSRAKTASVVLPEIPKIATPAMPSLSSRSLSAGGNGGEGSTGSGGGFGGGLGTGIGVGIGGGKNFVGKFKTLLGAEIRAERIAVYLDCSGSMTRYLPAVKAEIYEKFPDADVFAYAGALTEVLDGEVVGGRAFKAKSLATLKRKPAEDATETEKLSSSGRILHRKFSDRFAAGTAGAWLDVLSRERYDALVVFSDFRDGIRQRRDGKTVFADSTYSPTPDSRTARERRWEDDWTSAFSRVDAPKLYLFSIRSEPQEFLKKCVEISGGSVTILDLKKRAKKAVGE